MENKELILDLSIWRCGGSSSKNKGLGLGMTLLRNVEGYECCLGQFTKQLVGVGNDKITSCYRPDELNIPIPLLVKNNNKGGYSCTNIASKAMMINDNIHFFVETKIRKLQELFAKEGYTIRVIKSKEDEQNI